MFSRRHYEAIARVLQSLDQITPWGATAARSIFADLLAQDNARFDRERFIRACEPGANVRAK